MGKRAFKLRALGIRDGLTLWRVDGHAIRDALDVEFTNGAHHLTRGYVPEDEIWIDRSAPRRDESPFWIAHQIIERQALAAGAPYLRALTRANRAEAALRRRLLGDVPRRRQPLRRKILGRAADRTLVLVDGRAVRSAFDLNFTLGGHGYRYRFIARSEIWIDDAVAPAERPAVVTHEAVEVAHMARGMAYDDAHARASLAETRYRRGQPVRYSAA